MWIKEVENSWVIRIEVSEKFEKNTNTIEQF